MVPSPSDLQTLTTRVDKLERQNRRLKRVGLVLLLPIASLIAMGQARPTLPTVEAHSFILRDDAGRKAAEIANLDSGATLRFFDPKGAVTALVSGTGYTIFRPGTTMPRVELDGRPEHAALAVGDDTGHHISLDASHLQMGDKLVHISLSDEAGGPRLILAGRSEFGPANASIELDDEKGFSRASLNLIDGQPTIIVNDTQGFSAQLGSVDLVTTKTGEQHKTSAASLVLFGKDGKVIWSVP